MLRLKYFFLLGLFIPLYSFSISSNEMILTGAGVWLRESPKSKSERVELLHFGMPVIEIASKGSWRKIKTSTKKEGWVLNKYLQIKPRNDDFQTLLKILVSKASSSKNKFGDLVEVINYFDTLLQDEHFLKHHSKIKKIRDALLLHSLTIIPEGKHNQSPYSDWIKKHVGEKNETTIEGLRKEKSKPVTEYVDRSEEEKSQYSSDKPDALKVSYIHPVKRYALLIGNSDYLSSPLKNPVNDAKDMAEALKKIGYKVNLKLNLNASEMKKTISSFGNKLKKGSVGIYYYAGHAVQHQAENYLIPSQAIKKIKSSKDLRQEAISLNFIINNLNRESGSLNTIILDACRNSPFTDIEDIASGLSRARGLERANTRDKENEQKNQAASENLNGTLIAYSTSPNKVALDGQGRNSPYTESLIKNITQTNQSIESILTQTLSEVMKKTYGAQTPWYESSINGEFYPAGKNTATNLRRDSH